MDREMGSRLESRACTHWVDVRVKKFVAYFLKTCNGILVGARLGKLAGKVT
jgi:hypothetical protein